MSDKTLSQRLRELKDGTLWRHTSVEQDAELEACIAQSEAMEAQAGERVVMDSEWVTKGCREVWAAAGYNDKERAAERFRQGPYQAWACGWMESRLALVGSGIYAKPSQAIGEQTPVAYTSETALEELKMRNCGHMSPTSKGFDNVPLYRSPMSSEARDLAFEALEDARIVVGNTHLIDQALSALRG